MVSNYLVVDLGTGNTKVAIITSRGEVLGIKSFENNYYCDEDYQDAKYFLPHEWEENILNSCKELIGECKVIINGITASGARESIVLYDKNKDAFLGLPNIDNRGREFLEKISNKEQVYKSTGRWVTEDFPAAKLLGLREKSPEIYSKISCFTSLSEWVGEIFTGKIGIEPSQACETQLYDIDSKNWSSKLCEIYGVDESILPPILNSGSELGKSLAHVNQILGIDNVPFIVGGADTQIAIKSIPFNVGDVVIVSGTTSPVVTIVDEKYYDKQERCWTDCNLGCENYQVETNPGVTGLNYQKAMKKFFPDKTYEEVECIIKGKDQYFCTASFSSLNFSEKRALKNGGFVMKSPMGDQSDFYDMMWAVIGDIACSTVRQYNNLCKLVPNERDYIIGCGGGFQSVILPQMIADLSGKKVVLYEGFEQATLNGCLEILNKYFKVKEGREFKKVAEYVPRKDALISKYHKDWLTNRMMLNVK